MLTYPMFNTLTQGLRQLVFPDNCFLCRCFQDSNHERPLCAGCVSSLALNTPPFCAACSRHLEHFDADGCCASCRGKGRSLNRAWAACLYTENMRKLLHMFKYNGKTALHKTFIPLMTSFIDTYHVPLAQFDVIAPIPLHPARWRERGYNQAELLSLAVGSHYGIRHRADLLVRHRYTQSQAVSDQKQRWTNLEGAFRINASAHAGEISILLVDDLLTTGATADAAAAALKDAGAAYVGLLTLAITQ